MRARNGAGFPLRGNDKALGIIGRRGALRPVMALARRMDSRFRRNDGTLRAPSAAPSPAAFAASSPIIGRGDLADACAPLDSGLRRNDGMLCKGLYRERGIRLFAPPMGRTGIYCSERKMEGARR